MRSRYRILLSTALTVLPFVPAPLAAQQTWTNYTNVDDVRSVAGDGRTMWGGTRGGVVAFDLDSRESTVLTTAEGLRGNNVMEVLRDRSGTLWVRSELGVSSRSGSVWTRHTFRLGNGDSVWGATDLALDSAGRVIAAIGDFSITAAIAIYDGTSWNLIEKGNGLPANTLVQQFMVGPTGTIWGTGVEYQASTNATIVLRIRMNEVTLFRQDQGIPGNQLYSMAADSSGGIWLAGVSGISRYDGSSWTLIPPFVDPASLRTSPITVAVDPRGAVWVGGIQGVDRYLEGVWTHFAPADGLPIGVVRQIVAEGSTVWARGASGIARFDGRAWSVSGEADGLPAAADVTTFSFAGGGLVAGTTAGLARYDGTRWKVYNRTNTISSNAVTAAVIGPGDTLWSMIGPGNGIDRYDGATWRNFSTSDGLLSDSNHAAVIGRDGAVYVAGNGGLSRYAGGLWQAIPLEASLRSVRLTSIALDSSGGVWAGGSNGRIYRYDGASWTTFTSPGGGVSFGYQIGPICTDPAGRVWVASRIPPTQGDGKGIDGLYRYADGAWTRFKLDGGWPASNSINPAIGMVSDRSGKLWIAFDVLIESGTEYAGGLASFDGVTWTRYRPRIEMPRLAPDPVRFRSIALDAAGGVWLGTLEGGAIRFDGRNWTQFTEESGMASNEVQSIAFTPDGDGWFGTSAGITQLGNAVVPAAVRVEASAGGTMLDVAPNPVVPDEGRGATVTFSTQHATARLALRDAAGREVMLLFDGPVAAGEPCAVKPDLAGLPTGIYFLHLESGGTVRSRRLLLIR